MKTMETVNIVFLVIGAFDLLTGLASILTGKVYTLGNSMGKYTEESLKRYARPLGFMNFFAGLGLIADGLLTNELFKIGSFSVKTGLAALVASLVVVLVIYLATRKILVKK